MNPKPIPKSLHTVSVLANVALFIKTCRPERSLTTAEAVDMAVSVLGYEAQGDGYNLIPRAIVAIDGKGAPC